MSKNIILVPVKDTPKTARMIAEVLVPQWSGQVLSILGQVKDKDSKKTFKKVWEFCRTTYKYHQDPNGFELIRSPKESYKYRKTGIDCEDFSIIITCILLKLGYSPSLRIVDFGNGWQHIYVVCDGVVIDAVNEVFNKEENCVRKMDFKVGAMGMSGFPTILKNEDNFTEDIFEKLKKGDKLNKVSITKIANSYGITNDSEIKELTEYAIVMVCREIVQKDYTYMGIYDDLKKFYQSQPNLSLRTSNSILLQQYSTPSPIAYLMGVYCRLFDKNTTVFEPSAGNGLLTIASTNLKNITVNEIDKTRKDNLEKQGFWSVFSIDASQDFEKSKWSNYFTRKFDAIITNPPFGALDKKDRVSFDGYEIKDLDHLMAIRALNVMEDSGKAAIIIGGHTNWDKLGRVQAGKNRIFLNYLYKHYNVDDIILINGDLFSRQGTSFDIRLILIDGRKEKPEGVSPLKNVHDATVEKTFESLFDRVMDVIEFGKQNKESINDDSEKNEFEIGDYVMNDYEAIGVVVDLIKNNGKYLIGSVKYPEYNSMHNEVYFVTTNAATYSSQGYLPQKNYKKVTEINYRFYFDKQKRNVKTPLFSVGQFLKTKRGDFWLKVEKSFWEVGQSDKFGFRYELTRNGSDKIEYRYEKELYVVNTPNNADKDKQLKLAQAKVLLAKARLKLALL